jgi:hypothetical protein
MCTTSAFGDESGRTLRFIQRFDKHLSFHLQGEYVLFGPLLEDLHRRGSSRRVRFDGADWWSGRAGCYPIGHEEVAEEKR